MRTILTKAQQAEFLSTNHQLRTIKHKWSCRGMGNSKILDCNDFILGKAGGCGYDRFGAALGNAIAEMFPAELLKLAKRDCKGRRRSRKPAAKYYGLFYNAVQDHAYLDGACGHSCMLKVLNKIGFSLHSVGEESGSVSGVEFYTLEPVTSNDRLWH